MSDKDVILNNLHSIVGEAEWDMVGRAMKEEKDFMTVTRELLLSDKMTNIIVTITIEMLLTE